MGLFKKIRAIELVRLIDEELLGGEIGPKESMGFFINTWARSYNPN